MLWRIPPTPPQAWLASHEVFTVEDLDRIDTLDTVQKDVAKVGNSNRQGVAPKHRDSRISWIEPSAETEWLFHILGDAIGQIDRHFHLGPTFIHPLQLTEYDASYEGHFAAHVDEGYGVPNPHRRILSMSVQLSEPEAYEGGELQLYPTSLMPVCIPKQRGLATFFRSHVIHEVTPVTRGTRKSLVMWASASESMV
jgi:PKHD-type hydroxylase